MLLATRSSGWLGDSVSDKTSAMSSYHSDTVASSWSERAKKRAVAVMKQRWGGTRQRRRGKKQRAGEKRRGRGSREKEGGEKQQREERRGGAKEQRAGGKRKSGKKESVQSIHCFPRARSGRK
jgi:hypothetical protein